MILILLFAASKDCLRSSRIPDCFSKPDKIPMEYIGCLQNCIVNGTMKNRKELNSFPDLTLLPDTACVYNLLRSSELSNEVLGIIWATVNHTYPGQLTVPEFFAALALTAHAQVSTHVRNAIYNV